MAAALKNSGEMEASGMAVAESRIGRWSRLALASIAAVGLASCISLNFDTGGAALRDSEPSTGAAGSAGSPATAWLDRQQLLFSAGLGRMREQVDLALAGAKGGAGDALRRVGSRAIVASDACYSTEEAEGCAVAARSACQRASYTDGAPLASSTYVACSGVWGMRAGDAPDGVCKTKRRLNAALCW